ncbi:MAG TPA: hypothetical protein DDW65_09740 [Firmicutes bacterium]|jgi:uncharacterized protein|nr:hypothetical protein [Bacillota bacterium]
MKKLLPVGFLICAFFLAGSCGARLFAQTRLSPEAVFLQGNNEEVKMYLAKGLMDPNMKIRGETLLGISCHGEQELAKFLLGMKGIRVNDWSVHHDVEANTTYTALMAAVQYPEIVKRLIDKGALVDMRETTSSPNKNQQSRQTALMKAAIGGYSGSVKLLIDKGANLNLQDALGQTALMHAVGNVYGVNYETKTEDTTCVKLLIDKGANLNIQDPIGMTALYQAASCGLSETAKLLINKGAKFDMPDGSNAVYWAIMNINMEPARKTEMVRLFLDKGAKVDVSDKSGNTHLMSAASLAYTDIVKLLLDRGANINRQNNAGWTCLMQAAGDRYRENNNRVLATMILLLDKGAGINILDNEGNMALKWALSNPERVELLLSKGAKLDVQNKMGETPLMLAAESGYAEVAEALLKKGANPDLQDLTGKTALMVAAGATQASSADYSAYTKIMKLLLDKGAKPEIKDKGGNTALYYAQRYDRKNSVDLLVAKDANTAED